MKDALYFFKNNYYLVSASVVTVSVVDSVELSVVVASDVVSASVSTS
jgi:hypothetical protein